MYAGFIVDDKKETSGVWLPFWWRSLVFNFRRLIGHFNAYIVSGVCFFFSVVVACSESSNEYNAKHVLASVIRRLVKSLL